jgi:hypothetical protein
MLPFPTASCVWATTDDWGPSDLISERRYCSLEVRYRVFDLVAR